MQIYVAAAGKGKRPSEDFSERVAKLERRFLPFFPSVEERYSFVTDDRSTGIWSFSSGGPFPATIPLPD